MPKPPSEQMLDLVERCVLAFERDGDAGLDVVLASTPEPTATQAREHIRVLRHSGLLMPPELPERIGSWHVRQRLGSGGMGTVYLADQKLPIPRRAAVKVIRRGMDSHEVLARFAIEQRALAMLDHRGIARILDAGQTDDGRPFLAMDYVPGQPILRYCDERQLDTRQRLELFQLVCEAVQHAHMKGLLHRDLKPSNILVVDRDDGPQPIVIDFGVAKSVGRSLAAQTQLTLPGRLLGTPEYMSPEQATNEGDVDTRTDVYSLGVILYELLTSTLPHDPTALRTGDVAAVLRDSEPPTPSTRLTSLGEGAEAVAARRRVSLGSLRRALRGDLDWIVMKAIDRDRNRRYGMPAELAADIDHHLRHEPISAGAPTTWQRLGKYCGRNRLQLTVAGIVCGALAVGLVSSTVFHERAVASANQAAASAGQAAASLDAAMAAVDELVQVGDNDLVAVPHLETVRRDLMQRAVEFYRDFLQREPGQDPRLVGRALDALVRLGSLQAQLGALDDAMARLDSVDQLLASPAAAALPVSTRHTATVEATLERANLHQRRSQTDTAISLARQALPLAREVVAANPADSRAALSLARGLALLSGLIGSRSPLEAIGELDEAIELVRNVDAAQPKPTRFPYLLRMGCDRANLLRLAGQPEQALAAVAELRRSLAERPPDTDWTVVQAKLRLANVLDSFERPDDVLVLMNEIAPQVTSLVADHPSIVAYRLALLRMRNARANSLQMQFDLRSALAELRLLCQECEAGLALAPQETQLLRQLVIACTNIVTIHSTGRTNFPSWQWDEQEVESALQRATRTLDAIPAGEAQRETRLHRTEILQLWATLYESRGQKLEAVERLQAATTLAATLADEAPAAVEFRMRLTEMRRRLGAILLDLGRAEEARPIVDAGVTLSASLTDSADAKNRWRERHRDLLLLQLRACGATGQLDRALLALAEFERLGDNLNDRALDWLGRQEGARAIAKLLAMLPADDTGRPQLIRRGRALIDAALSYREATLASGTGHGTVAVMSGNTLQVARALERAAGDMPAAARRAGEAVVCYDEALQDRPSARAQQRVDAAAVEWLRCLVGVDDAATIDAAVASLRQLGRDRHESLALFAATATEIGSAPESPTTARHWHEQAIELLRAAMAAGMPATELATARFAALQAYAEFGKLQPNSPADAGGR